MLKEKAKEILEAKSIEVRVNDDPIEGEATGKVFLVLFLPKKSFLCRSLKKEFEGWGKGVEIVTMDDKSSILMSKFLHNEYTLIKNKIGF